MKNKKTGRHYAQKGKTKQADVFEWLETEDETTTRERDTNHTSGTSGLAQKSNRKCR